MTRIPHPAPLATARRGFRRAVALAAAFAVAGTAFAAAPAQAMDPQDRNMLMILGGIAAAGVIANEYDKNRDRRTHNDRNDSRWSNTGWGNNGWNPGRDDWCRRDRDCRERMARQQDHRWDNDRHRDDERRWAHDRRRDDDRRWSENRRPFPEDWRHDGRRDEHRGGPRFDPRDGGHDGHRPWYPPGQDPRWGRN